MRWPALLLRKTVAEYLDMWGGSAGEPQEDGPRGDLEVGKKVSMKRKMIPICVDSATGIIYLSVYGD